MHLLAYPRMIPQLSKIAIFNLAVGSALAVLLQAKRIPISVTLI